MVTAYDPVGARNVSVFTDGNGAYRFPPLASGRWQLRVRIVGFERPERTVDLAPPGLDVDFKLRLAEQPHEALPASYFYARMEWPSEELRGNFALACANCHQIGDPLWRKPRTAADWETVLARMEFRGPPLLPAAREALIPTVIDALGAYDADDFALPGPPTGDATRAILWEYEVDPEGRNGCHDLELALDGTLYTEDGFALHPETLERHHHPVPAGAHSIERAPDGAMWITVTGSDLMTRLDVETGEVRSLEHPEIGDDKGVYPHTLRFDDAGNIWYTLTVSNHVARLDPRTGEFTYYDLPGPDEWTGPMPIPVAYGLDVAPDQRIWWSQLLADRIGVLDPATGEIRSWRTPVQGPRRLRVGADGVVWVPGYASGNLARFDPRTEEWKVYDLPTKPAGTELPYALSVNRRRATSGWRARTPTP
jgi:streptogramin lyase